MQVQTLASVLPEICGFGWNFSAGDFRVRTRVSNIPMRVNQSLMSFPRYRRGTAACAADREIDLSSRVIKFLGNLRSDCPSQSLEPRRGAEQKDCGIAWNATEECPRE